MNTYSKFVPNVFLAKCEQPHQKGETILVETKHGNKTIPGIDDLYWCETCGSHSHMCHPQTGFCFHCNTNNWEPKDWNLIM